MNSCIETVVSLCKQKLIESQSPTRSELWVKECHTLKTAFFSNHEPGYSTEESSNR